MTSLVKASESQFCLMAKEGRRAMQTTIQAASTALPRNPVAARPHTAGEVIYKAVTVGAIVLVLGSLWIF